MLFARNVQHLFFHALKTFVKYEILNNYVDRSYEASCVTCHIVGQRLLLSSILCTNLYGLCIIILRCITYSSLVH